MKNAQGVYYVLLHNIASRGHFRETVSLTLDLFLRADDDIGSRWHHVAFVNLHTGVTGSIRGQACLGKTDRCLWIFCKGMDVVDLFIK